MSLPTPISIVRPRKSRCSRSSMSNSPMADPDTPIHCLAAAFQEHVHMPDPTPLYAAMGALAGNMLTGNPVWLMLVGSSGTGKTMLLKSMLKLDHTRAVGSIKGEAALLSGVKAKDRAKDATGGLLRELGKTGCLIFMDFASILSKPKDAVTEILGAMREIYDRTWVRDIGGEGGRSLKHQGRVFVIGGVTHAIDRHHEVANEMGERLLYYRYPFTDGYQEALKSLNTIDPEMVEEELALQVEGMFVGMGMSFEEPVTRRAMETSEADRIVGIAQLGARARSAVLRSPYPPYHVTDVPAIEVGTRMANELTQLWLGMEAIGVPEEDRWRVTEKVAMDSMPLTRRLVMEEVRRETGRVSMTAGRVVGARVSEVAKKVRVSETTVRRVMEELELLGLAVRVTGDASTEEGKGWGLTEWAGQRLSKVGSEWEW